MTLYEIKEEYVNAFNNIEVNEDGEIVGYEELKMMEGVFQDKAEAVACEIETLEAEAKAIKEKITKNKERAESKVKRADWLRGYLAEMLNEAKMDKVETDNVRISFRTSKAVNILDEEKIPDEYFEEVVTRKLSKTKVGDAIKSGIEVDGAEIEVRRNIQIK